MLVHTESDLNLWHGDWANYHVLLAMAQLGLFDVLADGRARSADTLAVQLHADARAIDICGRILTGTGLLNYADGKFSLTETAHQLCGSLEELKWQWKRQQNYSQLLDTVLSGHPAMVTSGGVLEDNEEDAREFLTMLYRHSSTGVQESLNLMRKLQADRPHHSSWRILDLGGGHGRYAATFAAELRDTEATLFDRPVATEVAQEIAGSDFAIRSGDFLHDELGGPYDIVFMSYVVSGISVQDIRTLFKRLRSVVNDGGFVVIQDMFVDPVDNLEPRTAIDFQLTLLLENEAGRFRTVPELCQLLTEAGFSSHQICPIEGQEFAFLVGSLCASG